MIDPALALLGVTLALTASIASLLRVTWRQDKQLKALAQTVDTVTTALEAKIEQIYLTEDDRKALGLPSRQVQVIEKEPKNKSGLPPACTVHKWSAEFLERGRLASNRGNNGVDGGNCFVRVCLKCKARQVRGKRISLHSDGSKQNHYHWHSD